MQINTNAQHVNAQCTTCALHRLDAACLEETSYETDEDSTKRRQKRVDLPFLAGNGRRAPGRANAIIQAHAHGATCCALARESNPHALGPSRSRLGPTRARKAHYAQSPTTQTRNTTGLQTPAPQHGHQAAHERSTAARFGPTSVVRAIPVEPQASVGAAQVLREGLRDDARCVRDAIQPSDQRRAMRLWKPPRARSEPDPSTP